MPESQEQVIDVVRDTTFVRFVADEAMIADLGRDLEIGFLQYGPMFTSQTDHGDYEVTDSRRVVTEVARLRMSYPALLNFVMSFLHGGIEDGKLKAEGLIESIQQWGEAKAASAATSPDEKSK